MPISPATRATIANVVDARDTLRALLMTREQRAGLDSLMAALHAERGMYRQMMDAALLTLAADPTTWGPSGECNTH